MTRSRPRKSKRPMWRFRDQSRKAAVPIPYKVLYENGRLKYGTPPEMVVVPQYLKDAADDDLLEWLEAEIEYHNSQ